MFKGEVLFLLYVWWMARKSHLCKYFFALFNLVDIIFEGTYFTCLPHCTSELSPLRFVTANMQVLSLTPVRKRWRGRGTQQHQQHLLKIQIAWMVLRWKHRRLFRLAESIKLEMIHQRSRDAIVWLSTWAAVVISIPTSQDNIISIL